jgi:HAD superfamily hydrolase (TIGR01509 family)
MALYKSIIFDCDGTLIDSEPLHQAACDAVSLKHNLSRRDPYKHSGLCYTELWNHLKGHDHPTLTFELWMKDIQEYDRLNKSKCHLRLHIKPLLKELFYNQPIRIGCASNAPRKHIVDKLGDNGVLHYFDLICARGDIDHPKPHPEPYLKICKHLRFAPEACLAVEDSPAGIQSAKAAGLTVVAFPHAYTQDADLSLADYVVNDIREITRILGLTHSLNEAA